MCFNIPEAVDYTVTLLQYRHNARASGGAEQVHQTFSAISFAGLSHGFLESCFAVSTSSAISTHVYRGSLIESDLAFHPLEGLAGLGLPRLLALYNPGVARQESPRFEGRAQLGVPQLQRLADAVPHRLGIAAKAGLSTIA